MSVSREEQHIVGVVEPQYRNKNSSIPNTLEYVLATDGPNRNIFLFLDLNNLISLGLISNEINQLFKQYSHISKIGILITCLVRIPNEEKVEKILEAILQNQNKDQNNFQNKDQFLSQLFTNRFKKIQINEFRAIYDVTLLQMVFEEEDDEMICRVLIPFFYQLNNNEQAVSDEIRRQIDEKFDISFENNLAGKTFKYGEIIKSFSKVVEEEFNIVLNLSNVLNLNKISRRRFGEEIFDDKTEDKITLKDSDGKIILSEKIIAAIKDFRQQFDNAIDHLMRLNKSIPSKWTYILKSLDMENYRKLLDLALRLNLRNKHNEFNIIYKLYHEVVFSHLEKYIPVNFAQSFCQGLDISMPLKRDLMTDVENKKDKKNFYEVLACQSAHFANLDTTAIDILLAKAKSKLTFSVYELLLSRPEKEKILFSYCEKKGKFLKEAYCNSGLFCKKLDLKRKRSEEELEDENNNNKLFKHS